MYELARPAIYSYSIQRGTPHVNLRQKRASLFNSQILVVALIGIFGGLKPKMCVHFSKDWRSALIHPKFISYTDILPLHLHSHYLKHITTISINCLLLPNTSAGISRTVREISADPAFRGFLAPCRKFPPIL